MTLGIRELDVSAFDRWDNYVNSATNATFFHRAGWQKVLERAFGHRTHFLYAEEDGEIVGILPLAQVKSILFGNTLSSLPFCVEGGIVADAPDIADKLRDAACALAEKLAVDALEFRNGSASQCGGWPTKDLYVAFRKNILADDEANLMAIPNRQRAMIRKGIKSGLESEWDEGVDRLYRVYSESVRNLGTPVFASKYFSILREVFGSDCSVLMIKHGERDIAGVMSFYFRDQVLPYYGGSIAEARQIKGSNHFMYWELLRLSAQAGIGVFDFGRSKKGTGPYEFKKNWGFEPQDLPYEYFLVKADQVPDVNPTNPKYRLLVETWSRLPLPLANLVGPFLARSLG